MSLGVPKILHIIPGLYIGGAEKLLLNAIKLLPEYEHHVACFNGDPAFIDQFREVANVHLKKTNKYFSLTGLLFLKKLERCIQPDIIHSHLLTANWLSRIAFCTKKNLLNSIHSQYGKDAFPFHFYTSRMERYSYYFSRASLVFVSDYIKSDYARFIPLKRKSFVLDNFVKREFLDISPLKYIPGKPLRLIAIGNLKPLKNHQLLIEVFKQLKHLPIYLDIYGAGSLFAAYNEDSDKHGLRLTFKGNIDPISSVIGNYHAFIFPSLYEGMSVSLLEAMAVGMPLILSDIEVFNNLVHNNAIYFNPAKVEECKEAILKAYTKGFSDEAVLKNKTLVLTHFVEDVYRQKLISIYNSLA